MPAERAVTGGRLSNMCHIGPNCLLLLLPRIYSHFYVESMFQSSFRPVLRLLSRQSFVNRVHIYTVHQQPLRSSSPSTPLTSSSLVPPHISHLFSWHVRTILTFDPALSLTFHFRGRSYAFIPYSVHLCNLFIYLFIKTYLYRVSTIQ